MEEVNEFRPTFTDEQLDALEQIEIDIGRLCSRIAALGKRTRGTSLVITKLEETQMWAGYCRKREHP